MKKTTYFYCFIKKGEILQFPTCVAKRNVGLLPDIYPECTFLTVENKGKMSKKTILQLLQEDWKLMRSEHVPDYFLLLPASGVVAWDNPDKVY